MAILLSARGLSKHYGPRPLFDGLTFGLFDGERTGLIGPNGSGKSTLLKILAGLETADSGEIARRRGLRVHYVAQQDPFDPSDTKTRVVDIFERALQPLGLDAYELEVRLHEEISDLGLSPDQLVSALSGGWRKRLAILAQTVTKPDLLLLDEPTNHLDLEGVLWLERYLAGFRGSFVVITHDRRFLESVTNRVIELNKRYAEGFFSSAGAYSQFLEHREAYFEVQAAREESVRNTVRREVEWLRRGPKARTTKQKARIDRAGALMSELKELEYRNTQDRSSTIDFSSSQRQTKKLIQASGIEKRYEGRRLFGPLDLQLGPGDKLGLLGSNGSGKSTLLKLLIGTQTPDNGTIKRADGLRIVLFDQHREQLDLSLPLRKALCENGEFVHYQGSAIHVVGWAERFLFSRQQMDVTLRQLSGGEQARVLIARLMLRPADVLLLDEPTNDLDIQTLDVLESSLVEFQGALVLVTHDRYLLDRVSDEILALDGRGEARFFADLSQWESWKAEQPKEEVSPNLPEVSSPKLSTPAPKKGLSMKEQKELKQIEASIRTTEADLQSAETALLDPSIASNATELIERQKAVDTLKRTLNELLARWEALESKR